MSIRSHRVLNRLLPAGLKTALRGAALKSIPSMRHLDMGMRLRHLASLGFAPAVIHDIGAAEGAWARMAHSIWARAKIVGFEPNQSRVPALEATRAEVPGFEYHRCFLGERPGEVKYADQQDQTSLFMAAQNAGGGASAPMLVLDELVGSGKVPAPQLMKLDVQGYELQVLRGASRALETCEVAILEANVYRLSDGMPTAREVLQFMWAAGFEWYDLMGMLRRGSDDAMAHLDLVFVKTGHRLLREGWE
jgi:FkbM family methyltransferase